MSTECKHEKFKKILQLLEHVDECFNIFKLYPNIDRYLEGKILSVNSNYRGYGIAGKLAEAAMQYMRENHIPVILVVCSSHFSARVCERLDFKTIFELPYIDYVVNGENPILPAEPHRSIKALIKEVA